MPARPNLPALALLAALAAVSVPGAGAQPSPPAARPDRTTAAYGDWVLRCERQGGADTRACEIAQTVQDQRGQVLAHLVMRRPAPGQRHAVSVQVGASATVSEPLQIVVEGQPALALPFRRCVPRGCFAELEPAEAELSSLAQRTEPAHAALRDGEGQPIAIPVSLRGLAAALQALHASEGDGAN